MAPAPGLRGAACTGETCSDGLVCAALPGGYCASSCDTATTCDGRCVDTIRLDEVCAKACTSDAQCRTDEGYVCDPSWRACLVPHIAVILPKQCPTTTPARDTSFSDSVVLPNATSPAATLAPDGSLVLGPSPHAVETVRDPDDCAEGAACTGRILVAQKAAVVHVMYAAGDNGLRVRTSRDGGKTFTTGPIAIAGTFGNATVGSDGRVHIVTLRGGPVGGFGSAQHSIEYAGSSDGGTTFSTPIAISGRDETLPVFFANPAIAVDARRRWIYAAYVRGGRDARWDIVLAASKDNGATWKRTTLVGDGCAIHMVPTLAVDPTTGTLHIAYYDSEGAVGRFAHATCEPGVTKCKLLGAINSMPFATLSTARQPARSLGDFQTLLVDDKRRVLHAIWAQAVDEGGKPVVRVFRAQAQLKK